MNQIVDSPSIPETFSKRPSWLPSHHLDVVCLSLIGLAAVALTAPGFFAPTTGSSPWIIDNILHGLRQRTLESTIFWYPMLQSNVLAVVIMGYLGFGWITGLWSSAEVYAKIIDPFQFMFLAEGLSLLFGMGAILATYYLGRLVLDRRAGWIAAAILALTPTFNMHLHNGKPDAAMTCLSAVAFIFLMKSLKEASYRNYIGGGLFMGLAVAAKYNAAILIIAGLLVHLAAWRRGRAPLGHLIHPRFFAAIMAGGLAFALTSFQVLLQPPSFLYSLLVSEPDKKIIAVFGVDPASFIPWVSHAAVFFKTEHGIALLFLMGLLFALFRRTLATTILAITVLLAFAYIGRWRSVIMRFYLFAYPALAVLAGVAVVRAGDWMAAIFSKHRFAARSGPLVIAAGFVLWTVIVYAPSSWKLKLPDTRDLAGKWIEGNIPSGAVIAGPSTPEGYPVLLSQEKIDRYLVHGRIPAGIRPEVAKTLSEKPNYRLKPLSFRHPEPVFPDSWPDPVLRLYRNNAHARAVAREDLSVEHLHREGIGFVVTSGYWNRFYVGDSSTRKFGPYDLRSIHFESIRRFYLELESIPVGAERNGIACLNSFESQPGLVTGPKIRIYKLIHSQSRNDRDR